MRSVVPFLYTLSNMADREEVAKYDKLQKHYESLTFEVVSSVFRALSKNKIIGTGSFTRYEGVDICWKVCLTRTVVGQATLASKQT